MNNSHGFEVGKPQGQEEVAAFADILTQALFFPSLEQNDWTAREGIDNFRLVRAQGRVVGGLTCQKMGQWFGGNCLPVGAVRCVGVSPDMRGKRVAFVGVRTLLEELNESNVPIASLFASTQSIYQRVGFEQAGFWFVYKLSTRLIEERDRSVEVQEVSVEDLAPFQALYERRAKVNSGHLQRNDWLWNRSLRRGAWSTFGNARTYAFLEDGRWTGYVVCEQKQIDGYNECQLSLLDWVCETPGATRRLLSFVAEHRSMLHDVLWHGGPAEPFFLLLKNQYYEVTTRFRWLLRMVNVQQALLQRGYAFGSKGTLHIEVVDDVLPWNNQRFVLDVENGQASIRAGGSGSFRITARGMASLFSGYCHAHQLASIGFVDAPDSDKLVANALFASPIPWIPDMF